MVDGAVNGQGEDDFGVVDVFGGAEVGLFFSDAGAGVAEHVDFTREEDSGQFPSDGGGQGGLEIGDRLTSEFDPGFERDDTA